MVEQSGSGDSLKDLMLSSVRSAGFWSFVAAVVGVVALIAGGALYFTVEEIRDFSVSVVIIGIVLVFLALVLSPRAIAIFLVGRQGPLRQQHRRADHRLLRHHNPSQLPALQKSHPRGRHRHARLHTIRTNPANPKRP